MKLNNLFKLGVVGLAMTTLASCGEEFLEVDNRYTVSKETAVANMEADPAFINTYANGIWSWMVTYGTTSTSHDDYAMMSILHSTDMAAEDMVMYASSWHNYDYQLDNRMYNYRRVNVDWTTLYTMVTKANEIIGLFAETPEDADLRGVLGNAYAVRAYSYLYLIQLFQNPTDATTGAINYELPGVPLYFADSEGIPADTAAQFKSRNTVKIVFNEIERNIIKAIELLEGYERPSKNYIDLSVAQGIAARYYLLNQEWAKAEAMAKAARADYPIMKGNTTSNGIRDGFMDVDNSEWMWGFNHSTETQTTYASFFSHISNLSPGYSGIGYTGRGIDARLYSQISDTDYRKMYWFNNADGESLSTATAAGSASMWKMPYALLKYGWDGAWTMDYLWMRASEMVLIEAEALARQEKTEAAAVVLKELMAERDPSWDMPAATVENVYFQRRVELIGEGFAYFDLKRMAKGIDRNYEGTNHLKGYELTVPAGDPRWVYQIPQKELQENDMIGDEDQND